MAKITLGIVTNSQDLSNINNNFTLIMNALNNNVLYRLNVGTEPNQMRNDLDFNNYKAYNLSDVLINGTSVLSIATAAQTAATQAQASATAAASSSTAATSSANAAAASAASASSVLSGALQKNNNLSDVSNVNTAKTNLGIDQVNNTSDINKPTSTAQQASINTAIANYAPLAGAAFTGPISITYAGTSNNLSITNTGTTGLVIGLTGNGGTTPAKFVRVANGRFQILNNAFSAAVLDLNDAGILALGSGVAGRADGLNPASGLIGEYIEFTTSAISTGTSGTTTNIASVTLGAGDYDIQSTTLFNSSVAGAITIAYNAVSLANNTLGAVGDYTQLGGNTTTGMAFPTPVVRKNFSASTTIYFNVNVGLSSGTCTATTKYRIRRIS